MKRIVALVVLLPAVVVGETRIKDAMLDSPRKRCGPSQCSVYGASGWACLDVVTNPATPPAEVRYAYAGCQGSGCLTPGGRDGTIYTVNTLADTTGSCVVSASTKTTSGTCSLRDCVAASGARVCNFAVGGTSTLASRLDVINPYITINFHTAPGGGFEIKGKNLTTKVFRVVTHDVVVRYARVRKGYNAGTASQSGNPITIEAGGQNVVIDHASTAWTQDENITIWSDGPSTTAPRNVTIAWSIMAAPLTGHETSTICGSNTVATANAMTGIDYHHNYLPNTGHRNPNFGCKSGRWINNVVYNWDYYASRTEEGAQVDFIGNAWKAGPLGGGSSSRTHEIHISAAGDAGSPDGVPSVYVFGNKGPNHLDSTAASTEWADLVRAIDTNGEIAGEAPAVYRRTAAMSWEGAPISISAASTVEAEVLAAVGASRRLDCDGSWVSNRDTYDARVVADHANGTGAMFADETTGCDGGTCWPTIAAGTPCTDTDKDGMPDIWEDAKGLNKNSAADAWTVASGQVYSNLERYLNGP